MYFCFTERGNLLNFRHQSRTCIRQRTEGAQGEKYLVFWIENFTIRFKNSFTSWQVWDIEMLKITKQFNKDLSYLSPLYMRTATFCNASSFSCKYDWTYSKINRDLWSISCFPEHIISSSSIESYRKITDSFFKRKHLTSWQMRLPSRSYISVKETCCCNCHFSELSW